MHQALTTKQLYTETQFHLDGLVAGSFAALLVALRAPGPRFKTWAGWSCVVIGAATALIGFRHNWLVIFGTNVVFGFTSLAVCFAGLLLLLLREEPSLLVRVFSLRPLRYIGRISYGIHLLQDGTISLLNRLPLGRVLGHAADSWLLLVPLRACVSIGFAALSYKFFEAPILRVKDRLR